MKYLYHTYFLKYLAPHLTALLADDEKILVEPACGAALGAIYCNIIKRLQRKNKLTQELGPVVVVVCGGNNISIEQLHSLKKQLGMTG